MQEKKQEKSQIKQNILQYLQEKGITEADYYKKSGTTRGILGQNNGISEENIARFLSFAQDVNYEWLFSGRGKMLKTEDKEHTSNTDPHLLTSLSSLKYHERKEDKQSVPLYNFTASAGLRDFLDSSDQTIIDYIQVPNLPKCDGAIRVTGDSMQPILKAGDIIIYKEMPLNIQDLFYGQMYLISYEIDGDYYVVVKYIRKSEKGEPFIKLVSENPEHASKDVEFGRINALALIKGYINVSTMG